MKFFLGTLYCVLAVLSATVAQAKDQQDFSEWLQALKKEALDKGVSPATVSASLDDAVFIERVIASDRSQAEFKETYDQYINKRVSDYRVQQGKKYMRKHGDDIEKVTKKYGVPARVVVAIIGIETNYGSFKLRNSLFDVLVTLSFDSRRGKRFRPEIFAALKMIDAGDADINQLKSSWAGALGVPQFMPTTYLRFAQDFDGDGKKNIWEHGPDLWASVAKYLSHYGWNDEKTWARKVVVPIEMQDALTALSENKTDIPKSCIKYKKHLQGWRSLAAWNGHGVRRMNKRDLPSVDVAASIILTSPDQSHAYLVYENFCSLMRYNPSFKYALSVGALSDQLKSY